jgi:hypothetical protein
MMLELMVYSCITSHAIMDDSYTKSCRWNTRGFYASEQRCNEDGRAEAGRTLHEPEIIVGMNPRIIERHRCTPVKTRD